MGFLFSRDSFFPDYSRVSFVFNGFNGFLFCLFLYFYGFSRVFYVFVSPLGFSMDFLWVFYGVWSVVFVFCFLRFSIKFLGVSSHGFSVFSYDFLRFFFGFSVGFL